MNEISEVVIENDDTKEEEEPGDRREGHRRVRRW